MRSAGPIRRGGFTLLEIILAMMITGVVAVGLFTTLSIAFKTRDQATEKLAGRAEARAALDVIRRDFATIPPPTGLSAGPMIGVDSYGTSGQPSDYIAYSTAGGVTDPEAVGTDFEQVVLFLAEDRDDPTLNVLVRSATRNALTTTEQTATQTVIARRVVGMSLRYYDGADWLNEWDSAQNNNDLPIAIELGLRFQPERKRMPERADELEEDQFTVAVLIPVPASVLQPTTDGGLGGFDLGF